MADPTRRQIAMMADEVGITDHSAAVELVRRAFEVSRSARAAIEADGPIDDLIPSKYRGWEITVYRDGAQAGYRAAIARYGPKPEGGEPASVVGEPSDEELAQAAKAAIHEYKYTTELVYFLDPDSSEYEPFLLVLRAVIAADRARAALAEPAPPAAGEAVGPEWRPCVKLPITVHVREQRPDETHVSTREGITSVRPDDLIMRGVHGEEYPIGRELFEKTYRLGPAEPAPPAEGEVGELVAWLHGQDGGIGRRAIYSRIAALLEQQQGRISELDNEVETQRMKVVCCGMVAVSDTPSSAAKNRACHPDYWSEAAEDVARQIDELMRLREVLKPAPPVGEEVAELVAWLRSLEDASVWFETGSPEAQRLARAAELLEQRHPEPVPVPKGPTRDDLWELWLRLNNELPDRPAAVAEFWEHAQIDARARAADLLAQRPEPVPVSERLPELRGMFERILCVARSSVQRPVRNIELADRLIGAVVYWAALPLPAGEVGHG